MSEHAAGCRSDGLDWWCVEGCPALAASQARVPVDYRPFGGELETVAADELARRVREARPVRDPWRGLGVPPEVRERLERRAEELGAEAARRVLAGEVRQGAALAEASRTLAGEILAAVGLGRRL